MVLAVRFCNLCNSRPAQGILEILRDGETQTEFIDACAQCVIDIPQEVWMNKKEFSHDN